MGIVCCGEADLGERSAPKFQPINSFVQPLIELSNSKDLVNYIKANDFCIIMCYDDAMTR